MKQFLVRVHKRQQYQSNTMYYGTFSNWQDTTEIERIDADYFIVTKVGILEFYHEYVLLAAYNNTQWLDVITAPEETEEDGTETSKP